MKRILVAGIGNIFEGDDGFGCEVARHLKHRPLPEEVTVTDFGIRGYDLVYALTDNFDAVIMLDAAPRGSVPGTLYLIEPAVDGLKEFESTTIDGHTMNPVSVIQMARSIGGLCPKLYLVGCEPDPRARDQDEITLSPKVRDAVPDAVAMVESLVENLLNPKNQEAEVAGLVPV